MNQDVIKVTIDGKIIELRPAVLGATRAVPLEKLLEGILPEGALSHPGVDPQTPDAKAALAALWAWAAQVPGARRYRARRAALVAPSPFSDTEDYLAFEPGDELVMFYDLGAQLREGNLVRGGREVPAAGNLSDFFLELPHPRAQDRPIRVDLPEIPELWELLGNKPLRLALVSWPEAPWGVALDPSGWTPIRPAAAALLKRLGLLEFVNRQIYPDWAVFLEPDGSIWLTSYARALDLMEEPGHRERYLNWLRRGMVLPNGDPWEQMSDQDEEEEPSPPQPREEEEPVLSEEELFAYQNPQAMERRALRKALARIREAK